MSDEKNVVLKFGGSVIHSQNDFEAIANEIQRFVSNGYSVVAVVSAYYGVTEQLIERAMVQELCPASAAYAELVSSGEIESAADLSSFLVSSGVNATFQLPIEFDFYASGSRGSARPLSIDSKKIRGALADYDVVIMPGFSAVDEFKESILLGRGGSDISAVVVAEALGLSSVRLLKDVDGIYDLDPNEFPSAQRLDSVDYERACEIGSVLIQAEAIKFAASKNVCIDIAAIGNVFASRIGPKQDLVNLDLPAMLNEPEKGLMGAA